MCLQKNASYMSKEKNLTNNVSQRRKNINLNQFPVWRIASAKFTHDVHSWWMNVISTYTPTHTESSHCTEIEQKNQIITLTYIHEYIVHIDRSNEVWGVHMMYILHIYDYMNIRIKNYF